MCNCSTLTPENEKNYYLDILVDEPLSEDFAYAIFSYSGQTTIYTSMKYDISTLNQTKVSNKFDLLSVGQGGNILPNGFSPVDYSVDGGGCTTNITTPFAKYGG